MGYRARGIGSYKRPRPPCDGLTFKASVQDPVKTLKMAFNKIAAALLSLTAFASAIEPPRNPWQSAGNGDRLLSYNETTPSPKLRPKSISVSWSSAGTDGQYITSNDKGDLMLEDIVNSKSETFVPGDQLPADLHEYWISNDASKLLIASNYTKQYRYSYFADYFVLDVKSGEKKPLVEDQVGDIQYAALAPTGDAIAFVRGNNLFLRDGSGKVTQVTTDGGPDMFHGVPGKSKPPSRFMPEDHRC